MTGLLSFVFLTVAICTFNEHCGTVLAGPSRDLCNEVCKDDKDGYICTGCHWSRCLSKCERMGKCNRATEVTVGECNTCFVECAGENVSTPGDFRDLCRISQCNGPIQTEYCMKCDSCEEKCKDKCRDDDKFGDCDKCHGDCLIDDGNSNASDAYAREFDRADCECKGNMFTGCYIDPNDGGAPKGSKCYCTNYGFICSGKVIKCTDPEAKECSGCTEFECCSGNCSGYE